jgi:hypothetical protein
MNTPIERLPLICIAGTWRHGQGGALLTLTNPATAEVFAQVQGAGQEDIAEALEATHAGFEAWRRSVEMLKPQRTGLEPPSAAGAASHKNRPPLWERAPARECFGRRCGLPQKMAQRSDRLGGALQARQASRHR